jgi:hypothetical protein
LFERLVMGVVVRMLLMRWPVAVPPGDGLGRGQHEPAGLDSFCADQVVGQVANCESRAAKQDHFQTALLVEMHVRRGDDPFEMMMLQVGQPARDPRDMMVVNQSDDTHSLAIVASDGFLDQRSAHEAADGLAPVRISMQLAIFVEEAEQISANRHTEPDQRVFHGISH